jgi:putative ATP-dependent endonuclease of OLD family
LDELIANKDGTSKGRTKTSETCDSCNQNIFIDNLRDYSGDEGRISALNDLLSQNKTKYPSILSDLIYNSPKPLPSKITDLFEKVNLTINPPNDD